MSQLYRESKDAKLTSLFLSYAKNVTSQCGEDGILEKLFEIIGFSSAQRKPFCVDVGAWDGVHLSNTRSLLQDGNWCGLLFEANPARAAELSALYEDRIDVHTSSTLVQIQGESSLSKLLRHHNVPLDFEFITIDVDGADYWIWQGIGNEYHPCIVCIEFNPTISNDIYFVQEPDSRVQQGSSLLALVKLGESLGYKLVVTTTFNAIFVRNDLFSRLPSGDYSIAALHSTTMVTELFQTYDGELMFVGPKKLLWHRIPINPQKMQVLHKKERKFPFAPPHSVKIDTMKHYLNEIVVCVESYKHIITSGNKGGTNDAVKRTKANLVSFIYACDELYIFTYLQCIVNEHITLVYYQLIQLLGYIHDFPTSEKMDTITIATEFNFAQIISLIQLRNGACEMAGKSHIEISMITSMFFLLSDMILQHGDRLFEKSMHMEENVDIWKRAFSLLGPFQISSRGIDLTYKLSALYARGGLLLDSYFWLQQGLFLKLNLEKWGRETSIYVNSDTEKMSLVLLRNVRNLQKTLLSGEIVVEPPPHLVNPIEAIDIQTFRENSDNGENSTPKFDTKNNKIAPVDSDIDKKNEFDLNLRVGPIGMGFLVGVIAGIVICRLGKNLPL